MALNLPNDPTDGQTYLASNGINYVYNLATDRWTVEVEQASATSVFTRDVSRESVLPVYAGDDIELKNSDGFITITIDPEFGIFMNDGLKYTGEFEIDGLPPLP
jgi:hypothetical protein